MQRATSNGGDFKPEDLLEFVPAEKYQALEDAHQRLLSFCLLWELHLAKNRKPFKGFHKKLHKAVTLVKTAR